MEKDTEKEMQFIAEQKKTIIDSLKNAGIPKEGANDFMEMLYGMIAGDFGTQAGITENMKTMLKQEWPAMKEEILKGYEG